MFCSFRGIKRPVLCLEMNEDKRRLRQNITSSSAKHIEVTKKKSELTLAVPRTYKNVDGVYETDFLDCILWTNIAENTTEYCKTGDVVGVKGRVQTRMIDKEDGTKYKKIEIIAERVTFLSSKKENTIEEETEEETTEYLPKESKKNNKNKN